MTTPPSVRLSKRRPLKDECQANASCSGRARPFGSRSTPGPFESGLEGMSPHCGLLSEDREKAADTGPTLARIGQARLTIQDVPGSAQSSAPAGQNDDPTGSSKALPPARAMWLPAGGQASHDAHFAYTDLEWTGMPPKPQRPTHGRATRLAARFS
jgi:hypothetical protein